MSRVPTLSQQNRSCDGVSGLLLSAATLHPDASFLRDRFGTDWTYAETAEKARSFAGWLHANGVRRGDRVAIHLRNRAEIAVALFAVSLVGGIYVVLNAKLREKGLRKILDQAEPVAIVADPDTAGLLPEEGPIGNRVYVGEDPPAGWTAWDRALADEPFEREWPGVSVDAAGLVFTSGSTGVPRGVTLSHDNIRFVVAAIQDRLRYRPEDVIGCFLPAAFDYGLYQIFLAAQSGACLYLGDPEQVGPRLPRIMKETEVSVLPGVPSVYAALIALGRRRALDLPRLRAITNTGERLPLSHIEELRGAFPNLEVFVMYGLTECKRVSIMTSPEFEEHRDAVGRPLADTEVYAVSESGERLPPGEVGELVVRGRHVALGYWRAPEETDRRFRKRSPEGAVELFTGDSGSVDEEGFIYFSARSDDWLKHRGNRISPVEIENEACSLTGVVEASLHWREADDSLHLFVTTSEPMEPASILEALGETLEPAKVPEFLIPLDEMPKSVNGKIDRKDLAARVTTSAS